MNTNVSILILNWNGKHLLKDCLDSVFRQTYKDYEVILVDNASKDDSVIYVSETFKQEIQSKKLKIICNTINYGFAEGNNIGVKWAKQNNLNLKYIVLLNNDTIVDNNFLKELVNTTEKYENTGIVQSNILYPIFDGNLDEKDKEEILINDKKFYISKKTQEIENSGTTGILGYNIYNIRKTGGVGFYAGGAALLFKSNIVQLPFDSDYFMYSEDVYFSWLIRMKGYKIGFAEKSYVLHLCGGWNKRLTNPDLIFYAEHNRIMNLLIFYDFITLLKILPILVFEIFLKNFLSPKNTKIRISSYFCILKNICEIIKKRSYMQAQRKLCDKDILKIMSSKIITEKGITSKIINKISFVYCFIFRIKTLEFQKNSEWLK